MQIRQLIFLTLFTSLCCGPNLLRAQSSEEKTVQDAIQALDEIMAVRARKIPAAILKDAHGVAIFPEMLKGGFVIGARHGVGVVVRKDKNGGWQTPFFVKMTGASIGLQAGLQATDVILVFKTQRSVQGLMREKFTIGADASVAAGPVGRQAAAATDAQLKAEILSYSRSRGLFAGVAIDGGVLRMDRRRTQAYYAPIPGQPPGTIPASALKLVQRIAIYSGAVKQHVAVGPGAPVVPQAPVAAAPVKPVSEREQVRQQLAVVSKKLQAMVDPQWQRYLKLPPEVYTGLFPPNGNANLVSCLKRYDAILADPKYKTLTGRKEFVETHTLLQRLIRLETPQPPAVLKLPPPPK